MPSSSLPITIIQPNIIWEDKAANLKNYTQILEGLKPEKRIVILPEMFTTGFSMNPKPLAEEMDGNSVRWMKEMASKHKIIIAGSLIIEAEGNYYNRFVWMQPDGKYWHYDKRHLFAYAGEDKAYSRGQQRTIVSVNGWRICLVVCYDLRFPVWLSNQKAEYDVLVVVANWPERRSLAWLSLLQARAIENQCYVVGVNRTGVDANNIEYNGRSCVFDPLGEPLLQLDEHTVTEDINLSKEQLENTRLSLPFLKDADEFILL